MKRSAEREALSIVSDQMGATTWNRHIADASAHIISAESLDQKSGIYHLSPQGESSWFGFTEKIFENVAARSNGQGLKEKTLDSIGTTDYPTPALRPLNSRMDAQKIKNEFGL